MGIGEKKTISNWENGKSLPDIVETQKKVILYGFLSVIIGVVILVLGEIFEGNPVIENKKYMAKIKIIKKCGLIFCIKKEPKEALFLSDFLQNTLSADTHGTQIVVRDLDGFKDISARKFRILFHRIPADIGFLTGFDDGGPVKVAFAHFADAGFAFPHDQILEVDNGHTAVDVPDPADGTAAADST